MRQTSVKHGDFTERFVRLVEEEVTFGAFGQGLRQGTEADEVGNRLVYGVFVPQNPKTPKPQNPKYT